MNLAISSLIIFIIVSPAILARRIYYTRELSKSFTFRNTLQEIFSAIFLSFILHFCWISVVRLLGHEVDFEVTLKLLLDPQSIKEYTTITEHIQGIFGYFISLTLMAMLVSFLIRNIIRTYKLDRTIKALRYDNNWYYIFSGEVLDIKEYNSNPAVDSSQVNDRIVDVLTKSGDKYTLYTGNLVDYQLNANNSVDYIVLSSPRKQVVGEDETVDIHSNYFVIPYSEILNINIKYVNIEES